MPLAGTSAGRRPLHALLDHREAVIALAMLVGAIGLLPVLTGTPVPGGIYGRGIVAAAFLTMHAVGLILVHRSDRFINFAQVQIGALGGTLFAVFVQARPMLRLVDNVCPPCLEMTPAWVLHLNYGIGLVLGLGLSVAVGLLTYAGVVRRFANATRLAVTVATIFVVQILAGLRDPVVSWLTTEQQRSVGVPGGPVGTPVGFSFSAGGATFTLVDLLAVATAVAAVGGLTWYLRATATGNAIRAAADNRERAQTLGIDVDRITSRIWLLVGLLSGAAAAFTVMSTGESAVSGGLNVGVLVRILAVVVVARMVSLPIAAIAAVAFGVLMEVVLWTMGTTLPLDGALVVVIGGLLLLRRRERRRADESEAGSWRANRELRQIPRVLRDLPEVRRYRRVGTGLVVVLALGSPWILSPRQTNLLTVALIYAIVGLSLLILTGWAGQISLGQFSIAAVGGFLAAVTGWNPLIAVPAGAVAGAVVAVAVGLPALKLRGLYLAITTLAFALSTTALLLNPRYLGSLLPDSADRPVILGMDLDDQRVSYYLMLLMLVLAVGAVTGLRRSRTGRVLIAGRDNEPAAASVGVSITRSRLTAFAVSGMLAAVAGVLFTYQQGGVRPEAFSPELSVTIFIFTVLGGFGSIAGPILGFTYYGIVSIFSTNPTVLQLASGVGGLALIMLAPGGLAELAHRLRDTMLRRIAKRHRIVVPSLIADRERTDADRRAPLREKRSPGGGTVFVPRRYGLIDQWALSSSDAENGHDRDLPGALSGAGSTGEPADV